MTSYLKPTVVAAIFAVFTLLINPVPAFAGTTTTTVTTDKKASVTAKKPATTSAKNPVMAVAPVPVAVPVKEKFRWFGWFRKDDRPCYCLKNPEPEPQPVRPPLLLKPAPKPVMVTKSAAPSKPGPDYLALITALDKRVSELQTGQTAIRAEIATMKTLPQGTVVAGITEDRVRAMISESEQKMKTYTDGVVVEATEQMKCYTDGVVTNSEIGMKKFVAGQIVASEERMKTFVGGEIVASEGRMKTLVAGEISEVKQYVDGQMVEMRGHVSAIVAASESSMKTYVQGIVVRTPPIERVRTQYVYVPSPRPSCTTTRQSAPPVRYVQAPPQIRYVQAPPQQCAPRGPNILQGFGSFCGNVLNTCFRGGGNGFGWQQPYYPQRDSMMRSRCGPPPQMAQQRMPQMRPPSSGGNGGNSYSRSGSDVNQRTLVYVR